MFEKAKLCALLFLFAGMSFAQTSQDDERSLGDIAKELRQQKKVTVQTADIDGTTQTVHTMVSYIDNDETDPKVEKYLEKIAGVLAHSDYDELEREADEARSKKTRFQGGAWVLYSFYDAVKAPAGRNSASDKEWQQQIEELRRWVALKPESATARTALGSAYLAYAWKGRSETASYKVTQLQWQSFSERSEMARQILEEAAALPAQCPYRYAMMINLAKAQGWSRAKTKALVDESFAKYPDFHHSYRLYADYLQKKWFGKEGDAPAFADEISARIGGREGEFVYFEVATTVGCGKCSGRDHEWEGFSWSRIKTGYAAMQHMYGTSTLNANRFAVLAFRFNDASVGKPLMQRIGAQWDQRAWSSEKEFELAQRWAGLY